MSPYIAPGLKTKDLMSATKCRERKIFEIICESYNVTEDEVKSDCRKRTLVEPRQIIMFFLYKKTARKLKSIGELMNRDHSSVIYANNTVQDLMDTNKIYKLKIESFEKMI
jgi:chromosomal replication initiator protein